MGRGSVFIGLAGKMECTTKQICEFILLMKQVKCFILLFWWVTNILPTILLPYITIHTIHVLLNEREMRETHFMLICTSPHTLHSWLCIMPYCFYVLCFIYSFIHSPQPVSCNKIVFRKKLWMKKTDVTSRDFTCSLLRSRRASQTLSHIWDYSCRSRGCMCRWSNLFRNPQIYEAICSKTKKSN